MFALLIHIYYPDSWKKIILEKILLLRKYRPFIMVNLCTGSTHLNIVTDIKHDFPEAIVIITPNKGKDIGGKLALIKMFIYLKIETDYIIMLHDKISPQAIKGETWRNTLFTIIEPDAIPGILNIFEKNKKTGIIGSSAFLMNEYDQQTGIFDSTNNEKIKELLHKYNLRPANYSFIGGMMFWIRTSVILNFFSKVSPLTSREMLEEGNVMDQFEGTYTHTWERLMCWIATAQDYTIKGI